MSRSVLVTEVQATAEVPSDGRESPGSSPMWRCDSTSTTPDTAVHRAIDLERIFLARDVTVQQHGVTFGHDVDVR